MPSQIKPTGAGPWLRQKTAAQYIGASTSLFAAYQRRGWITPDSHLPSPSGGRPLPVYLASSLDAALARMNDPKARILSAGAISAAKRKRSA